MIDAVHAKDSVCTIFMIQPNIPVSLTVIISRVATITDTMQEVIGPQIKPPKVTITSDGSYFKNRIIAFLRGKKLTPKRKMSFRC